MKKVKKAGSSEPKTSIMVSLKGFGRDIAVGTIASFVTLAILELMRSLQ